MSEIFLDTETTAYLPWRHKIVEIACIETEI